MTAVAELVRTPTLEELAETANNEQLAGEAAGAAQVQHYIRSGHALLQVRARLGRGEFQEWSERYFIRGYYTAMIYMRLARCEEILAEKQPSGIREALDMLRGVPGPDTGLPEVRREARRLRAEGLLQKEVAEILGRDQVQVCKWCMPPEKVAEYRAKAAAAARRRHAAAKALQAQERERAIVDALKDAPDVAGKCHEMATKLNGLLGAWRVQADSGEKRLAINEAHAARDQMMDAIVRALGIS